MTATTMPAVNIYRPASDALLATLPVAARNLYLDTFNAEAAEHDRILAEQEARAEDRYWARIEAAENDYRLAA